MINLIKEALGQVGVSLWRINQTKSQSAELYFIRRSLDMRRMKETDKYVVTVYRDFEHNGKQMRGHSAVTLTAAYTMEDAVRAIADAFAAAKFVTNPTFDLPAPVCDHIPADAALSPEVAVMELAEALFQGETEEGAFLNSAELFVTQESKRILTAEGTDVCYTVRQYKGEFVAQCKAPVDVEMYHSFSYNRLEKEALTEKVKAALKRVKDRAKATPTLKAGSYTLVLAEQHVAELFSYFTARSEASSVYSHYSNWQVGSKVQEEGEGEALSLTLCATEPYSPSGVKMIDRPLVQNGTLAMLHGDERFSSYLGIPTTGEYRAIRCENGSVPFAEMQKEPHLFVASFSDFQMDPWSGHFGGEIRLAYYFDGQDVSIVTGGSVNGNFTECKNHLRFSKETFQNSHYEGPLAVSIPCVQVAGNE